MLPSFDCYFLAKMQAIATFSEIKLSIMSTNIVLVCDEYLLTFANQIKRLQRGFFKPTYHNGSTFTLQKTELSSS
jgi:hypothetical protein